MKHGNGLEATRKVETRGRKSLGDTKTLGVRVPGIISTAIRNDAARRGVHYSVILREILEREYKLTKA